MRECNSTLDNLEIPRYNKAERNKIICKSKEKEEAHLYNFTIEVAIEVDMYEYDDIVLSGVFDHLMNRSFLIQEETPFILFKEHIAEEFGIPVMCQRFWKRQFYKSRPLLSPLTPEEETRTVSTSRNAF
ncbi:hypothetical protein RIF29_21328 [Crotalaria pallida]|uniref:Uncharacterized protein n=1 Tax=Crotalaria pallida TaxID=3830 RepID=A0AAN9F4C4_CROPI